MNPYQVLGLRKNASRASIREAYRRLAAVYHPDKQGGSAEQFGALVTAHDILCDEERRAWYDEHGFDRGPHEVLRQRAMSNLSGILQGVIGGDADPTKMDVVQFVRSQVMGAMDQQKRKVLPDHERALKRIERMIPRSSETIAELLRGHEAGLRQSRQAVMMAMEVNRILLEILDECSYDYDRFMMVSSLTSTSANVYGMGGFR